ncbi:hypothetical protein [Nostoc sp.]|uniref:hypothetical protein n=1 Tax=Nostoc sp. TaxID=1180 RepID=UPI002FFCCD5C
MAEVRFTPPFKRRLKTLTKRYRQIQIDIQPIIDQLEAGNFIGDQISGISCSTFNLHILGGRDAHPTRNVQFQIMQTRCGLA